MLKNMTSTRTPNTGLNWKGFALLLQFNRRSPMSAEDFDALHSAIGVSPVFPTAVEAESYKEGLMTAREFVGNIYGLDPSDVETW